MPPLIGLTGGIGAGKSEALAALERLGAATLSTDAVVHALLATDEVRDLLVERLGPSIAPDGRVDRSEVASRVFGEDEQREWLEGVLWPCVGERIVAWRAELESAAPPPVAAVVEVPLLFESGMQTAFDHTIAISADEDVRASRAGARGHASVDERSVRQLSQEEKAERADFDVRNDGSRAELRDRLSQVLETIGT
jgi:dephospho-CoA kinase